MKSINSISPDIRDNLLNSNIGKYNHIKEGLIQPIGTSYKIYNDIKKDSIAPGGLLNYINNHKNFDKKGELEENLSITYFDNRNFEPVVITYDNFLDQYSYLEGKGYNDVKGESKDSLAYKINKSKEPVNIGYDSTKLKQYSSFEDETYHDPKDKNWINMGIESAVGYILGDNIALSSNKNGLELTSSSLDVEMSLPARIVEYSLGNASNLTKVGLESLGISMANSVMQKTRISDGVNSFFEKPVGFYDAIDILDFDKMGISIPNGISNFSQKTLPIYFYSEIKKNDIKDFSWSNNDKNIITISEEGKTNSTDDFSFAYQSLLSKTQKLFKNGKIQTLVNKLGATKIDGDPSVTSDKPLSRGRALKKSTNGDLARSWTVTNQYNKISSLIRPFDDDQRQILKNNLKSVRPNADSTASLEKYGVLQNDGFVKIAPYKNDKFGKTDIKKYMFSIENLAWKDSIDSLISETSQDGPNGGRIMWFPPYDINFNETTTVNWNQDTFIGRGEPVYTYVNTERNGTMSFKIIVDHPSVINYYKRNGNDSITDDDYLRFIAGDDIKRLSIKDIEQEDEVEVVDNKVRENIVPKEIKFKVFFPNNYSGVNDKYENALKYLYNGHACSFDPITNKSKGYEMEVGEWKGLTDSEMTQGCYINNENTNQSYFYRVDSFQNVTLDQRKDTYSYGLNSSVQDKGDKNSYSFKEIYENIENINQTTIKSKETIKAETRSEYIIRYIDKVNSEVLLNKTKSDNDVSGTTETEYLYEQAITNYNISLSLFNESEDKNNRINNTGWGNNIEMTNITSNTDVPNSSEDNSIIILKDKFKKYEILSNNLLEKLLFYNNLRLDNATGGTTTELEVQGALDVYNDVYSVYLNSKNELTAELNNYSSKNIQSETNNEILQALLDANEIIIIGSSSKQGIESENEKLANNRCNMIKEWLYSHNKDAKFTTSSIVSGSKTSNNTSSKESKIDRYVEVKLIIKPTIENNKNVTVELNNNMLDVTVNTVKEPTTLKRIKKSFYNFKNSVNGVDLDNDEAKFFEKIGDNKDSNIIFEKLSEKIKYFSPAFHSMTPEGFNARLTFLHQCTRQGPTLEATSSNSNKSADNMAFGRPPICVLRIGDFYHTKIVIDSLNIDFDPLVWDLNEEGVGVQPMIANVTMNFKFIGGSDLTGPIARLQNAITFNFFANTGVYDDRNDRIVKHEYNKDINKFNDTYDALYNPRVYDK